MIIRPLAAATLLLTSACTNASYDQAKSGTLKGDLFVMWVDNRNGQAGDGRFLYVPNPRSKLTFIPAGGSAADAIQPTMMYTDGGSVPKLAQAFKGFEPWGYAPAYMIHDWLFVAKHCLNDNAPKPAHERVRNMSFRESAQIAADVIRTLVEDDRIDTSDLSASLVTLAVTSPFSLSQWNLKGACENEKVRDDHRKAAENAIPGSAANIALRRLAPADRPPVARIVGIISVD